MATIGQIHPWEITGKHLTAVKQKINDLSIPEEQMASTQLKTLHEDVEMEPKSLIDYDKKFDYLEKMLRKLFGEEITSVGLCSSLLDVLKQKQG